MKNPFQQPPFTITDEYLDLSISGFSKKMDCIDYNGNSETRGIATLFITDRQLFSGNEEALMILMQAMVCEQEWNKRTGFSRDEIRDITEHYLLPYYAKKELLPLGVDVFNQEFKSTTDFIIDFAVKLPDMLHIYKEPWFGIKFNKETISNPAGFDPLQQEKITDCFYFHNEWDNKEYFAISAGKYIYFDWFLTW